jgi:hypothetical protein
MEHDPNRTPAPSDEDPRALQCLDDELADDPEPPVFDAHGFDPAEFDWRPVPRKRRADGWTIDKQRQFIEVLADTGLVSAACEATDMSVQSAYRLRRAPGSEGFARAWAAATAAAVTRLVDVAFTRAIEGEEVPVFDRDGVRIGARWRHNDRLLMFLIRAYQPERFAHAHRDVRPPDTSLPAPELPVVRALEALAPVPPAEPHTLLPPDQLAEEVLTARAVAEIHDRYPVDERERYRRPTAPPSHPAAHERRRARQQREAARAAREDDPGLTFD